MPKFDFSVKETATAPVGSAYSLIDGWHVMKVVRMATSTSSWGAEQVDVWWDVAEGPEKGKCADWGKYQNLTHFALDGRGAGFTKRFIHAVSDSNPGFEAAKAFVADDFKAFEGKLFGARSEQRDSKKLNPNTGRPYRNTVLAEIATADEARAAADSGSQDSGDGQAPVIADEDIPF